MCFKLPSIKDKYLDHYKIYYYPNNLLQLYQAEVKENNETST
jgi:hypothetical protein